MRNYQTPRTLAECSFTVGYRTARHERIIGGLVLQLKAQLPVDGVYLDLHGAMVTEAHDDGEGERQQCEKFAAQAFDAEHDDADERAEDRSEDHADTRAFLDRRIEGVMRFEKIKAQFFLLFLLGKRRFIKCLTNHKCNTSKCSVTKCKPWQTTLTRRKSRSSNKKP